MLPLVKTAGIICLIANLLVGTVFADTFRIGVVAPLTGGSAASGETVRNSILLAAEQFDPDHDVSFLFEDDQLTPKITVTAVTKLIEIDLVQGLIVFGSPTSLAVNGIAESRRVPMLAFSIVDRVVTDKHFVVKHWVSLATENDMVVREVKNHGYRQVAVIATTNDAMLALRDHFVASKAAEVVLNADFPKEENDFRTVISQIRNLNPDAVYFLLWAPQPGLFAKKLREAGYKGSIFGVHNLEDPNEISAAQGALNGAWFVTGDDSHGEMFLEKYRAKFGKTPTAGGLNAFDSAKLMIEGLRSGKLNEYLHTVKNFKGAYGVYGASGNNDFTIGAITKKVENGTFYRSTEH